jgi:hypothetical protein
MVQNVSQSEANAQPGRLVMTLQCDTEGKYSVLRSRQLLDS